MNTRVAIGALAMAAAGLGMAAHRPAKGGRMSDAITRCEVRAATLNLMGEAVLTRASVTADTIERHAPAVRIGPGDPRLAVLSRTLRGLKLEPAALPRFEMRGLVRVECAGGGSHVLAISRTGEDGRVDLSVDGALASTRQPLRRELEAVARPG